MVNGVHPMTHLPKLHSQPWSLTRSTELLQRAVDLVPGTTHSLMKRPEQFCPGRFPVFLARGRGALVEDVDGNEYVDFICGLGATSLGHGHPELRAAVAEAVESGVLHSLPTELEVRAGEALVELVPGAEMVRFFKTGADATSAAVRLARARTGRSRIVTIGYNGWHDHFMFDTPGVPEPLGALTTRLPLFQPSDEPRILETVREGADEIALVLLSLPYNRRVDRAFLAELRALCTETGVCLAFDEIVTGFRLALGGAQQHFGIEPDFSCFSKALAAGMPLSAVVGPRRTMAAMAPLQVSTTFGGETLSLAVCERALAIYRSTDYVDRIHQLGRLFREGVESVARDHGSALSVVGYDPLPMLLFHPDREKNAGPGEAFQGEMAARGVLLRRDLNFISGAHTRPQIEHAIEAASDSLRAMKAAGTFA